MGMAEMRNRNEKQIVQNHVRLEYLLGVELICQLARRRRQFVPLSGAALPVCFFRKSVSLNFCPAAVMVAMAEEASADRP